RLRLPDGGGDDGHRPRPQLPAGEAPDDVPRLGELPIGEVRIDVVDDDRSRAREGGEQQVGDELYEVVQRGQRRLAGGGEGGGRGAARARALEGGEQQVGDELFEVVQRVQRRLPGEGQVEVRAPQRHVVESCLDRDVGPIGGVTQVAVEREFGVEADDVADSG